MRRTELTPPDEGRHRKRPNCTEANGATGNATHFRATPHTEFTVNETDRAWLAGFIDGEGCFHAAIQRRPTVRSYPQFHISNCNRVVMEHVAKLLGVEGKLKGKRGGKDGWRCKWTLTLCDAKRLLWLLDLVEPYLVAKREEAAVFRAFCSTFRGYKAPRPIPREVAAERLRLVAELRAIRQREYSV